MTQFYMMAGGWIVAELVLVFAGAWFRQWSALPVALLLQVLVLPQLAEMVADNTSGSVKAVASVFFPGGGAPRRRRVAAHLVFLSLWVGIAATVAWVWQPVIGAPCQGPECPVSAMVRIPAGPFTLGCRTDVGVNCSQEQLPAREVTLGDFDIDRTEVTAADYEACVVAGACTAVRFERQFSDVRSANCTLGPSQPRNCVTWFQARDYCGWARRRLCSEAEWEKAARGADSPAAKWSGRPVEWGDWGPSDSKPQPAGSTPPDESPYGVRDQAGSLTEWVADLWRPSHVDASPTGKAAEAGPLCRFLEQDKVSSATLCKSGRVVRGGGIDIGYRTLLGRRDERADTASHGRGLRCCREPLVVEAAGR